MLTVVTIFFLASIFLYCLLGGADFGAGIIELFSAKKNKEKVRKIVTYAMAPIWEANHMWLIIAVVILFNGFPIIYSTISISLYIPLILLLVGIVLRGCAFTFRHYDAFKDFSQEVYSTIFAYSSFMVAFFFGLIVGALVSGKITPYPNGFYSSFIAPWLNPFSISIGLFLCSIFAFLAAVFLIGDTTEEETRVTFIRKSKIANVFMVITGTMVFLSSYFGNIGFAERFLSNIFSIVGIVLATLSLPLLWNFLNKKAVWASRITAGALLLFILSAFYAVYFPEIVIINGKENLTILNSAAPDITLAYLGGALLIGSVIIFPSLFYLFKVFKLEKVRDTASG
jgi:cytochrome bd ubiquinol oxidase subunit II